MTASRPWTCAAALCAAFTCSLATADGLQQIVVKAQRVAAADSAFSVNTTDARRISDSFASETQAILEHVPGLEIRRFHLGGVADSISMRGFANGSHGGDIGFVLDGIPLNESFSHADGYADLNVVVPLEVNRIDVYKGPTTALYGNYNRGGTVLVTTQREGNYGELDLSGGSDDTWDLQGAAGIEGERYYGNIAAQHYATTGFRPQSDYDRQTVAARIGWRSENATEFAVAARVHRGDWDSAGYVSADQFDNGDPYALDPRMQNDGGDKSFETLRAEFAHSLGADLRWLAFAYGTEQDFTRYFTRPVSAAEWRQREEAYDRSVRGVGTSLRGRNTVAGYNFDWTGGVESYSESTDYGYHDGLDHRTRLAPAIYDRTYELDTVSAYAEAGIALRSWLRPTVGLRYDSFSGDCASNGAETGGDPCNRSMNDYDRLSPKLGLRSTLSAALDLRASIADGFQLPNPRGLFSAGADAVDPNEFRQYELGANWHPSDALRIDIALFRLESRDEIRELPAGSGQYFNAGKTRREGIEASLDWSLPHDLSVELAAAVTDTEIRANPDASLVGRELPGVPESTLTAILAWQPASGPGARLAVRDIGAYAINGSNSAYYDGYTVVDATLTWRGTYADWRYRAYLGVDNLFDRKYSTSASIIGGVPLHAPGAPRTAMLGVQLDLGDRP